MCNQKLPKLSCFAFTRHVVFLLHDISVLSATIFRYIFIANGSRILEHLPFGVATPILVLTSNLFIKPTPSMLDQGKPLHKE